MKTISFIVPAYNEEESILQFLDKLLYPTINKIKKYKMEIIVVDDGSVDKTSDILCEYAKTHKNLKVISFARNFGKEAALSAGFRYANGDAVIAIDSDGEQPPNLIPKLIRKWEEGYYVVTVVRSQYGKHGSIKKLGSRAFYKMLRLMGDRNITSNATDFRLLDRAVIDEFNKMTEHHRITRGLIDWMGFKTTTVSAKFTNRLGGKPSYDVKKLIGLAVNSFISMSTTPLVIFGYIGGFITVGSGILGLFVIIQQHIMQDPLHLEWSGAVQMAILIAFLVGLILISQAITALYISQIHTETQNRPLYIVDKNKSRNL